MTTNTWRYVIPGWGQIIEPTDIFGRDIEDNETLLTKRDQLAALLENSDWYKQQPDSRLLEAIAEFKTADDDNRVEDALIRIYDLADEQHVWLDPYGINPN